MPFPVLGTFLSAAVPSLAKKVLTALGLGTITYAGLQTAFNAAQTQIIASYGQISGNALQLADLAGVGQSIGIILGAMAARVGMIALSKIGKVL